MNKEEKYIAFLKANAPDAVLVWDDTNGIREQVAIGDGCDYDTPMDFLEHRIHVLGSLDSLADEWEVDYPELIRYLIEDVNDNNLESVIINTYDGTPVEDL